MKNDEGLISLTYTQVNVWLGYAQFYYEHLTFQYYRNLYCKYYIDADLGFWKSGEKKVMQTLVLTNGI
ncbi:MAG: hypothetical protein DLM72_21175 [Candidatus Nitrosopolaris wilkensis]|nr:MAG: hypothetical protein DLM72_21175 [Candidatus Nitrosopolaris wilkensis]